MNANRSFKEIVEQYNQGLIHELDLVAQLQLTPEIRERVDAVLSLPYKAASKITMDDLLSDDPRDEPVSDNRDKLVFDFKKAVARHMDWDQRLFHKHTECLYDGSVLAFKRDNQVEAQALQAAFASHKINSVFNGKYVYADPAAFAETWQINVPLRAFRRWEGFGVKVTFLTRQPSMTPNEPPPDSLDAFKAFLFELIGRTPNDSNNSVEFRFDGSWLEMEFENSINASALNDVLTSRGVSTNLRKNKLSVLYVTFISHYLHVELPQGSAFPQSKPTINI